MGEASGVPDERRRNGPRGPQERLVHLETPVGVQVWSDGRWWDGDALSYRGQRVLVAWADGLGARHETWVAAEHVRRAA